MNLKPCDVMDLLVREKLVHNLRTLPLDQKVRFLAYNPSKITTCSALKRCTYHIQSINGCVSKSPQNALRLCKIENLSRMCAKRISLP
jgi:hypothetical protein